MPFAVTGGVLSLFITGTHFSISSAVGFLSLFGVYVLDGVILISQIKQLRGDGASCCARPSSAALSECDPC